MTDRSLRADQLAHARRTSGQPEPGLRDQIAEAVRDNLKRRTVPPVEVYPGGPTQGGMGLTEYDIADVTLAVVQQRLDAKEAEADRLRASLSTAAGLLRDTAERTEQQRTVNAGVLRGAAKAIDDITGSQR